MENRRSFFKGLAAFASGVVGAKVASYIPKKEEPKEELLVSNTVTIKGPDGKDYHPVVVEKAKVDEVKETKKVLVYHPESLRFESPKNQVRKLNV